ncbi:hypothetical protein A3Q56_06839, partial [Intoshia linei]
VRSSDSELNNFKFDLGKQIKPPTLKIIKPSIEEGGEDKYCFTSKPIFGKFN